MTVTTTSPLVENKTGNGVWTTIAVSPGLIVQNSDGTHAIKVIRTTIATGATSTLAETTDYTVALDGTSPNTGTITLVAGAPSSAYRYTVLSNLTPKQEVDLQNGTVIDMPTIESALDRLTLYSHKQDEKLERAVLLSEDTLVRNLVLDSLDDQTGKILQVNAAEDGFDYVDINEAVSVAAFDINALTADGSPVGSTDYVPTYDASAATSKKVLLNNLPTDIAGKTELTTVDTAADYLMIYDASATTNKKVLPSNLGIGSTNTNEVSQIQITNITSVNSVSIAAANTWYDVPDTTVTITPTATYSKIMVGYAVSLGCDLGSQPIYLRLVCNGAPIFTPTESSPTGLKVDNSNILIGNANCMGTVNRVYIDETVSSTAARVYKLQACVTTGTGTLYTNRSFTDTDSAAYARAASQIFAMELK